MLFYATFSMLTKKQNNLFIFGNNHFLFIEWLNMDVNIASGKLTATAQHR